ncbi:hypothetical protein HK104_010024 [Borealophlyctis nickersoniae]|nr:hypothetical protein HK104_010024 [Borealophlyctis nickersoniae]
MSSPRVWLITGCSSGFGRELVTAALAKGDKVIATARSTSKIADLVEVGAATLRLDVTDSAEEIQKVVAEAINVYGHIDILVNNAGFLVEGAIEETSPTELYTLFNTNVFGLCTVTTAILPHMRARKSGVIANMGSIGGWNGTPVAGPYCATKFALEGLTEALRAEVAHLGIDVCLIEPGYFRTDLLRPGNRLFTQARIQDYDPAVESVRAALNEYNGKQPGDPVKGAKVIVDVLTKSGAAAGREIPVRLPLGSDALVHIKKKCDDTVALLEEWRDVIASTDHEDTKK